MRRSLSAPGMDVSRKAATLAASHATERVRCVRSRVRSTLSATSARSATPITRGVSSTVDIALFYARMTLTFSRRLVGGHHLPDPSSLLAAWVVGIKGVGFLLAIVALVRQPAAGSRKVQAKARPAEGATMSDPTVSAIDADPEGQRLPIKLDSTTNGEFAPVPLDAAPHHAQRARIEWAPAQRAAARTRAARSSWCRRAARRHAARLQRRARARAAARRLLRRLARSRARAAARAPRSSARSEFIFDVQGHFVNPTGAWTQALPPGAQPLGFAEHEGCAAAERAGRSRYLQCIGARRVRQGRLPRFGHRPHRAVVRAVDARGRAADDRGSARDARASSRRWRARTGCCLHGRVNPNQEGDLEDMDGSPSSSASPR